MVSSNDKKNMIIKNDSVTEIQVSDLYTSTETEDNDSLGRISLPKIPLTSESSDTCETDETEWLDDRFILYYFYYMHEIETTFNNLTLAKDID